MDAIERLEGKVPKDARDLIFRVLFSSIFLGLGAEHLLDDRLIQHLMPSWVEAKTLASVASGTILLLGGFSILLGYRVAAGARLLGAFLVVVTLTVHLPGCFSTPPGIESEWSWLWTVFQRSNLVKNLCLFGVCVHLTTHETGSYSLEHYLKKRRA
jgi:uncharacterized membrane protein YphA (DoxX/SURF4 family)